MLDDGRFDTGYKIVKFVVGGVADPSANDVFAKLSTEITGTGIAWDWGSNLELAWAAYGATSSAPNGFFSEIDPDNMIIQDLFISNGGADTNYMIFLEKYDITDWQGALAMVRNKAQNVG